MPYPPRPQLKPEPEFAGKTRSGTRATERLIQFVVAEYATGRSLRQIAELTDRTHSAVRHCAPGLCRAALSALAATTSTVHG